MGITSQNHLGLGITTVSNMNHTLSKLPIKLYLLVCQVCCCDGARIILLFLFAVCRAPNRAPMPVFFFLRFVGHQIVLYFVVPGLVCLLGIVAGGILCNVYNHQSFFRAVLTLGSGTDRT